MCRGRWKCKIPDQPCRCPSPARKRTKKRKVKFMLPVKCDDQCCNGKVGPPGLVDSSSDEGDQSVPTEADTWSDSEDGADTTTEPNATTTPLRYMETAKAPTGWEKINEIFLMKFMEMQKSGVHRSAAELVTEIQRDQAVEAHYAEIASRSASSASNLTNPSGSIRAWLADTEDGSQRREKDDQHATGHSSKSKPIKSTCVDELVGKNHLSVLGGSQHNWEGRVDGD